MLRPGAKDACYIPDVDLDVVKGRVHEAVHHLRQIAQHSLGQRSCFLGNQRPVMLVQSQQPGLHDQIDDLRQNEIDQPHDGLLLVRHKDVLEVKLQEVLHPLPIEKLVLVVLGEAQRNHVLAGLRLLQDQRVLAAGLPAAHVGGCHKRVAGDIVYLHVARMPGQESASFLDDARDFRVADA